MVATVSITSFVAGSISLTVYNGVAIAEAQGSFQLDKIPGQP